jgi:hypothetical protein
MWGETPRVASAHPFDAAEATRPLTTLGFTNGDAYYESDDRVTCAWLDRADHPVRLRVADIRRTLLPQLELGGEVTPLQIERRAGLAEQVHVQFFPNNLAGSEFNFYGPRMSRVAQLLRAKAGVTVRFLPAVRGSAIDQLRQLREVRLFQLAVTPSLIDELNRTDQTVGDMFRSASQFGEPERLEIILRPRRFSRNSIGERVRGALFELARNPAILDGAEVFKTAGITDDGHRRVVNLLRDELRVERPVRRLRDGSRGLDSDSVYDAIGSAYNELREELDRSRALGVDEP